MTLQTDNGRIVAFPASGGYIFRKANENRREGRLLQAVELMRRGLELEPEREDAWLDLAEILNEMGCYEQSNRVLYKLLSCRMYVPEAYYGLAANHSALMNQQKAVDSAANYLALAPEGAFAESAQEIIESLGDMGEKPASARERIHLRRSANAQRQGEDDIALVYLKRALKASRYAPRLYVSLGMAYLERGEAAKARRCGALALRKDPELVQAACLQAMAIYGMGYPKLAARLLQTWEKRCVEPRDVRAYGFTVGVVMGQAQLLKALKRRLRQTPWNLSVMEMAAHAAWKLGQTEEAARLWRRMLRIDPKEDAARASLELVETGLGEPPEEPGMLPKYQALKRLESLTQALSKGFDGFKAAESADPAWQDKVAWAFTLPPCGLQEPLLDAISALWPREKTVSLLRWLLVAPRVDDPVRRLAVVRLFTMGEKGPFLMLYGQHLTQVDRTDAVNAPDPWRQFRRMMLLECRELLRPEQALIFARDAWKRMTPAQRQEAVGEKAYAWVMAMKFWYLDSQGLMDDVQRCTHEMAISPRRVERMMKKLAHRLGYYDEEA